MISLVFKKVLRLIIAGVLISGCAHTPLGDDIQLSLKRSKSVDKQEIARVEEVIKEIKERNMTVEKSQEWLKEAYKSLKIKKLNAIPKEEYKNYKEFLGKATVYIIVHPAYYIFFQNTDVLSLKKDAEVFPTENIVERFYKKFTLFDATRMGIFKEQERILRDFLEFMSQESSIFILSQSSKVRSV